MVQYFRRLLGQKRVGHTGTLDPGAAGVLPLAVGQATRLAEYLLLLGKSYRFEITLGVTTDTLDASGRVVSEALARVTARDLEGILSVFTGRVQQVPPMVSAVRRQGVRLHTLARRGMEVEREPREVQIYSLHLAAFFPGEHPRALLDLACSSGTYVRVLCQDMGEALGCGAHMSFLVRTVSGPFILGEALLLEEAAGMARAGRAQDMLEPMERGVAHLPEVKVPWDEIGMVATGRPPRLASPDGLVRLVSPGGRLLAVAEGSQGEAKPRKVFVSKLRGEQDEDHQERG
ncbi:MAG: tRNA pseudouridine(55) synthase TruB [Bacillota bacterium]